jgi:hypothetical protein
MLNNLLTGAKSESAVALSCHIGMHTLLCLVVLASICDLNAFLLQCKRLAKPMIAIKRPETSGDHWPEYMVEFRGLGPTFRWNELSDAAQAVGIGSLSEKDSRVAVVDERSQLPVCYYVKLPDDHSVHEIVNRCATVRRVLKIWGEGETVNNYATI